MTDAPPVSVPVRLEFDRMPRLRDSLPRLYLARKPRLLGAGRSVPRIEASLTGYELDGGKLIDYRKVCGFADKPYLPVTLPHVLATPLHLAMLIGELGGDGGEGHHRRLVAGRLEQTAEQHRDIKEASARPHLDPWNQAVRQISVGAGNIEIEDRLAHQLSP